MGRVAKGKWAKVRKWPSRAPAPTQRAREEQERQPTTVPSSGEEPEEE